MLNNALMKEYYSKYQGKNNLRFTDESFLETIKRNDAIPYEEGIIEFSNDIWCIGQINKTNLVKDKVNINFREINYEYKDIVKGVIYKYIVIDELSSNTIKGKMSSIKTFIHFLSKARIYSFETISKGVVEDFFEQNNKVSAHQKQGYKIVITDILQFIEINKLVRENQFIEIFMWLKKNRDTLELKIEKENGKIPEIPLEFFNKLISCASNTLENPNANFDEKIEACIILFLSQIGLRVGELRLLKKNCIQEISLLHNGENVYYMTYSSPKTKKKNARTFITKLAKKAYDYMVSVTSEDNEYLFSNIDGVIYSEAKFRRKIALFCIRNHKELGCLNMPVNDENGLNTISFNDFDNNNTYVPMQLRTIGKKDYIAYPKPHQFRVSVCNWLIRSGRGIDWVREHMNHLDYETTMHYIRRQDSDKKEKEVAKIILKEVVKKEINLIGRDTEILTSKIDEFIKVGNYNIEKDLEIIIDKLSGKIPIRQKASGYCIKSSFGRKCTHDGYSDDIYCAFGVCPNHFTTYKMVDISYKTFCDLKRTINYNIENKFIAQANMELNKLKRIINEALLPELKELKNEIEQKGIEKIISNNINIKPIVENLELIFEEIEEWKMKNIA